MRPYEARCGVEMCEADRMHAARSDLHLERILFIERLDMTVISF